MTEKFYRYMLTDGSMYRQVVGEDSWSLWVGGEHFLPAIYHGITKGRPISPAMARLIMALRKDMAQISLASIRRNYDYMREINKRGKP